MSFNCDASGDDTQTKNPHYPHEIGTTTVPPPALEKSNQHSVTSIGLFWKRIKQQIPVYLRFLTILTISRFVTYPSQALCALLYPFSAS